jgi:glycosyltransferase involved in cell wall biosynthesis
MARISILLPVHNAQLYLSQSIDSVVRQTFGDWELLAVDDGSEDGSLGVLREWAARDGRITVVARPHSGLVDGLNGGLERATGEYVARMDADDVMHPQRLELQLRGLEDDRAVAVMGCKVRSFPRRAILEGLLRYEEWINSLLTSAEIHRDIFVESPLAHPSVLIRQSALEAVGGYEDHGWAEDYDLWLRMHLAGFRFAKVPETLHFWRDRSDRLTRTDSRYSLHNFRRMKLHYLQRSLLRGHGSVQVWGAGRGGKVWARHVEEAGLRITRFIDIDPKKIGGRLRGAPVMSPGALRDKGREVVLVVVGVKGARALIRHELDTMGYREHHDYVCVA